MKLLKPTVGVVFVFCVALMGLGTGVIHGADFEIEVLSYPDELVPGVVTEIRAKIRNASGHPITVSGLKGQGLQLEVLREDGARVSPCRWLAYADSTIGKPPNWKGFEVEADWTFEMIQSLCFDSPGEYTARFFVEAQGPYRNQNGEVFDAWEGELSTDPLKIEVLVLQGVDRKVYDAYGPDFVSLTEHWGDILRQFPSSTYAAYAIWDRWAKGTAVPFVNDSSRDRNLSLMEKDPSHEVLTWKLPCSKDGRVDAGKHTRLKMPEAARCRDSWIEIALTHHPDIWFADEMRLKLALDRFMLGDKDACLAGLEALSEHGRPFVAEKARALLEAMQSKGMLPGASKDQPVVSAKPEPCEPTEQ